MKYNEMIKEKEGIALEVDPETLDTYAKHNQAFLTVCNKNTFSKQWYKHYTNCCRTLEICIIEKTIKDIWAQNFYFELEKAVKVFNRITENRYISKKFKTDCRLLTSGLYEAERYFKNAIIQPQEQSNSLLVFQMIITELNHIEKEELQSING